MESKALTTLLIIIACVFLFPVAIGILAGIFGILGGIIGGIGVAAVAFVTVIAVAIWYVRRK